MRTVRESGRCALEMAGVSALATAHPLFTVLAQYPTYFTARQVRPLELVAFTVAVVFVPPLIGWVVTLSAGLISAGWASFSRRAFIALFVTLASIPALERAGLDRGAVALGLLGGVAAAVAHAALADVRWVLAYASVSAVVVPLLFLSEGSILPLVRGGRIGTPSSTARSPVSGVMLVFDELPLSSLLDERGNVDASRFPAFAELQSRSTFYAGAVATSSATHVAIPELLTGRHGAWDAGPSFANHPDNLLADLTATHMVRVEEVLSDLCPPMRCMSTSPPRAWWEQVGHLLADAAIVYARLVAPPSAEATLPSVEGRWSGFWPTRRECEDGALDALRGPERVFREVVAGLRRTDHPAFTFMHVLLPHMPHVFLPTGERYAMGWSHQPEEWPRDGRAALLAEQRHLLQVGFADRLLGELIDRLDDAGMWDEVLLVVTADHGVSFVPGHPSRGGDEETLGDVAPVPLFVKAPRERGAHRDESPLETIQVRQIISSILDMPRPARSSADEVEGHVLRVDADSTFQYDDAASALRASVRRKREIFGHGWSGVFAAGPRADLMGRAIDAAPSLSRRVALTDRKALAEGERRSELVPALVEGVIEPGPRAAIAVEIDGAISAVVPVDEERGRFAAMVPWWVVSPGRHRVRLAAVDPSPGGPVHGLLREQDTEPGALSERRLRDGLRSYDLGSCAVEGAVERVDRSQGRVFVSGWARPIAGGTAPLDVLLLSHGAVAARAATGVRRHDLAGRHGPGHEYAGFALDIPKVDAASTELRIFVGTDDGCAAELRLPEP